MDQLQIATWATVVLVAAGLGWYVLRGRASAWEAGGKLERTMSFMSQSIYENMFPKETELESVINTVVFVEEYITREEVVVMLRKLHKEHSELYRLWSRAVPTGTGDIVFEDVENIHDELDAVVSERTASSDEDVMDVLQEVILEDYPLGGLLYRFYTVKNENGDSVLVVRIHHAVGDGIGLMDVMMKVLTKMDGSLFDFESVPHKKRAIKFSAAAFLQSLCKIAVTPVLQDTPTKLTRRSKPLLLTGKRKFAVTPGFSLD
eukprot:Plantae.Rhodophyta-Purpureofilum_apyrenoidigerum.ctg76506.p1 GENE.Plantae.Rhodophyta-Purpureofilum_apyrenoidigerum.ctg76506~~Plantae.Rhodophyta-Purpureofilum_apyrenoidigerum.ctg76506.p1  ORF type:complete len:261 (-),score=61.34 Plantae.Rhodophyta-Purpureofilum_apyrenoidigerum.ctg76506:102-884(-)